MLREWLACTWLLLISHLSLLAISWDPDGSHPCNIQRFTLEQIFDEFGIRGVPLLYEQPIVILQHSSRNSLFREMARPDALINFFPPDFLVTLSSSNSLSERRRTIPLSQYLNETITSKETPLDRLSNETWYLFGETYSAGTSTNEPITATCFNLDELSLRLC